MIFTILSILVLENLCLNMPLFGYKYASRVPGRSIQGGGTVGDLNSHSINGGGAYGDFSSQSIQGGGRS